MVLKESSLEGIVNLASRRANVRNAVKSTEIRRVHIACAVSQCVLVSHAWHFGALSVQVKMIESQGFVVLVATMRSVKKEKDHVLTSRVISAGPPREFCRQHLRAQRLLVTLSFTTAIHVLP